MQEKRSLQRFQMNLISVVVPEEKDPNARNTHYMISDNICAGGVFLKSNILLPPRTRVRLDFFLPVMERASWECKNVSLIEMQGTVVRCEEAGMAVRFDGNYRMTPLLKQMVAG